MLEAGNQPGQRALVYRNSGMMACVEALRSNYRCVAGVMGDQFFASEARGFVSESPPMRRTLVGYGADFPEYLRRSPACSDLPWLADLACLDQGWLRAHLAADAEPVAAEDLQKLPEETLLETYFGLHPSLQIVHTSWALSDLWQALYQGHVPQQAVQIAETESVFTFWRQQHEVQMAEHSGGLHAMLTAIGSGQSLEQACSRALEHSPGADISLLVGVMLSSGWLINHAKEGE
ncbi:MAG: DNA-binding domain-containing protein [Henriciella sp.]|uniref:DNA-binding domain-containing protein n=1 Tax=Henriciella sp. TaxID=1968823 RepID=UPI0032EF0B77